MNPSLNLIKDRLDLSPFLFHFTKGKNALESIEKIIAERKLVSDQGYVCFTETPLVHYLVDLRYMNDYGTPMYSYYGLGFTRDLLIDKYGARPVIYTGEEDKAKLQSIDMDWRYVKLDVHSSDFTWLREWRIRYEFDFSELSLKDMIVIAPTQQDLDKLCSCLELVDIEFDYEHEIKECVPNPIWTSEKVLNGITIDNVKSFDSDRKIAEAILHGEHGEMEDMMKCKK